MIAFASLDGDVLDKGDQLSAALFGELDSYSLRSARRFVGKDRGEDRRSGFRLIVRPKRTFEDRRGSVRF